MPAEFVIVGLGNPGSEYERTRHNVGFDVVDRLAAKLGCAPLRDKQYGALVARGRLESHELLLVKPQSYMNLSGEPVRKAVGDQGIEADHLIVVHDELDLPVAKLKLQANRGPGGHNGVASIIQALGTKAFLRVRIGIDKPPRGRQGVRGSSLDQPGGRASTVDWVLTRFSKSEQSLVDAAVDRAVEAIEAIVLRGMDAAGNAFNRDP